ncbi:MAG: hypothetical protein IKG77_01360, partial [Prevotella sp.]|nr:hypothetical protein [Prevotella sp.]
LGNPGNNAYPSQRQKQCLGVEQCCNEGENAAYEKRTCLARGIKQPANREKGAGEQGKKHVLARFRRPPA